jgi:sugar (pentulose or hexulose) kinase
MNKVCVVYDIGKTNKKLFVFNQALETIFQEDEQLPLTVDEDGDECEDLFLLSNWIKNSFEKLKNLKDIEIVAVNVSAYGASLVHLDKDGKPVCPLYNYTKAFPKELKETFVEKYGPLEQILLETASPDLGMLNSANQLYWLKNERIEMFKEIRYSLHLPQYCIYLLSGEINNEFTSVGCHTMFWDFSQNDFHQWIKAENLKSAMLPPLPANSYKEIGGISYGIGIHDSSAALVPYLQTVQEPFLLLSTGTWSITLNPFCEEDLDAKSLSSDCLNFIRYDGKTVRAARLFSGNEHNRVTKHLSDHFNKKKDYFKEVAYDFNIVRKLRKKQSQSLPDDIEVGNLLDCPFMDRSLNTFGTFEEAYHQFIIDLVAQQITSMKLTFGEIVPKIIYVDGGFSKNEIFMSLLSEAFFDKKVYASSLAIASSLGAALVIEEAWKPATITSNLLNLVKY